jgi:hypothetical protein
MSEPQKSPYRGESMMFLMMLAPLALLFILFEMRLGVLKHSAHQNRDAGHYISTSALALDIDDDDPLDDLMEED